MKAGGLKLRAELELDRFALDPYCKLYLPLWKLDGDSFADRSAYGHLCTNYGSLWTPQGRKFDGVDDYVETEANPAFDVSQITVEGWALSYSGDGDYKAIATEKYTATVKFELHMASSKLTASFNDGTWHTISDPDAFPLNQWQHCVGTYDGHYIRLYRNGNQVAISGDLNLALPSGTNIWRVGRRHDTSGEGNIWNGLIDEVRIYNRALTPQEILDHYIIGKEMFG